ncbi:PPM-type phosphatase domain-containing protein [Favolaschia claudopus]|uniref:PPM-type phosphatase domain-containing protein n=1 Tax=Favolaschia claudopus TaxID=2862362 RepID=A0AAW0A5B1_9AGAR
MAPGNLKTHEGIQTVGDATIYSVQFQPTDRPIEDRISISVSPDNNRIILGVYDGHGGTDAAEHVSKTLPPALLACPPKPEEHTRIFEATDKAMLDASERDYSPFTSFLRARSGDHIQHAKILRSGCMALILDIDLPGRRVIYANAGDCRAVVCEVVPSGDSEENSNPPSTAELRIQQTVDLNAKSSSEQERLSREHPNEPSLIVSGRLFGKLMSTRGFGDGYYKLPRGLNNWKHKKYVDVFSLLDRASKKVPMNEQYYQYFYGYRTPPYITPTPDTGVMSLSAEDRETGSGFVVCGSDGLFDLVTSEMAAETVREGIRNGVGNLATYLLERVMPKRPGDDVTVIVLTFG